MELHKIMHPARPLLAALLLACPAMLHAQSCPTDTVSLSTPIIAGQLVTATLARPVPNPSYDGFSFGVNEVIILPSSSGSGGGTLTISLPVSKVSGTLLTERSFTPPEASGPEISYNYTFSLAPTPYSGCTAQTGSGSFTVAPSPLAPFKGSYALMLGGVNPSAIVGAPATAEIGSIVADGKGNITAGELDMNSAAATFERLPATGSYTLDAAGTGKLKLKTDEGTQTFALTLSLSSSGQQLAILEDDATGTNASGTLMQQTLPTMLAGSWAMNLTGETACTASCTAPGGIETRIFATGLLSFTAAGAVSATINSTADRLTKLGTLATGEVPGGAIDDQGRLNFTLSTKKIMPEQPQNFVGYFVTPERLLILSMDPHQSYALLSGVAQ